MANNTTLNPGAGGDVVATEDVAGVKYPVSKLVIGAAGAVEGDVATNRPLPAVIRSSTGTELATAANPIRIDPTGATTQPVSGTVSVNYGSGTFPVSAASLPLPAGAATAAKQPAIGTPGAASPDVLTVQGVAAMTPLKVDGSGVTQPVSGTVGVSGTVATNATLVLGGQAVGGGNPLPVTNAAPLPAGTNTIGGVIAQQATGVVYSGTTPLTPKFAAISASAAGDNTLVSAVAGKRLRVLKYTVVASGPVAVKFRSPSGGDLTGAMPLTTNSGIGGAYCPVGLFETAAGDALILNLSAAAPVAGHLTYIEV